MHYLNPHEQMESAAGESPAWMQMSWSLNATVSTDEWKVMQFTGLKDKNGKQIYEGDIVRKHRDRQRQFVVGDREVDDKNAPLTIQDLTLGFWDYENAVNFQVIGNIYEDPELLANK
jgi:uncharacterized phage protein (TIGR01671 family)